MSYLRKCDLYNLFDKVYYDLNEININEINWIDNYSREIDPINLILNHRDGELLNFLICQFEKNQPKTYMALRHGDLFYAIKKSIFPTIMSDVTVFGIIVNDNVFFIYNSNYTYEKTGDNILKNRKIIPIEILNSWYYRMGGISQAENITMNILKSNLPSVSMSSISYIIFLNDDENHKEEYAFLEEKMKRKILTNKKYEDYSREKDNYMDLRCLLDTRMNSSYEKEGVQIFIADYPEQKEPELYIIPEADVFRIKKLKNPVKAIDDYASHILLGNLEEFNFMQYAKDF